MIFHVIIPVHNRLQHTCKCLESLVEQDCKNFCVYVVDDGSTDNTAEVITERFSSLMEMEIITGDGNLWWGGAIRAGVQRALAKMEAGDVVVTLNNDITIPHDYLPKAQALLVAYPDTMLGSISVDMNDHNLISQTGWRMRCWPLALTRRIWWPGTLNDVALATSKAEIDFLPGTGTFTPEAIIRAIGTINSDRFPHYHGDSEFSYRVRKRGYQVLLCRELVVYHDLLATGTASNVRQRPPLIDVMKSFFIRRSSNCLLYRWRFAVDCAPRWALVPFLLCDTFKSAVRSFGSWLVGPSIDNLKKWNN